MFSLRATYEQAAKEGCIYAKANDAAVEQHFHVLMEATHGDPCTGHPLTGDCRELNDGKCPCHQKYHTKAIAKRKGDALEQQMQNDKRRQSLTIRS